MNIELMKSTSVFHSNNLLLNYEVCGKIIITMKKKIFQNNQLQDHFKGPEIEVRTPLPALIQDSIRMPWGWAFAQFLGSTDSCLPLTTPNRKPRKNRAVGASVSYERV